MARSARASDRQRPFRILVVDDHPAVRLGLERLFEEQADLEICGQVDDTAAALQSLATTAPDLAIVDVSLGDESGLDSVRRLEEADPSLRILVMSIHDETVFADKALAAGALGYVEKTASIDELLTAIRTVLRGDVYLSPAVRRQAGAAPEIGRSLDLERLSGRELSVLEMVGRGLTSQQIGEQLGLSGKTVEAYRGRLKKKLGVDNNAALLRMAVEWTVRDS